MSKRLLVSAGIASLLGVAPVHAAEISTHVLDISRGEGGAGVPVTLSKQSAEGSWQTVATSRTQPNGRAENFGEPENLTPVSISSPSMSKTTMPENPKPSSPSSP